MLGNGRSIFPRRQLGWNSDRAADLHGTGVEHCIQFLRFAKAIPRELDEAARLYRFRRMAAFVELELPYGAIGLVWNSRCR